MASHTIDLGRVVGPQGEQGVQAPVDANPTSGSPNAVSSNGTYTALQGKEDVIDGSASSVAHSLLTADRVLATNENRLIVATDVSYDQLAAVKTLGTVSEDEISGSIETTAQKTEIASLTLSKGTYLITGWAEIHKIPVSGRYGLQLYREGTPDVQLSGSQNYYSDMGGQTFTVGWNVSQIVEVASSDNFYISLLASPASLSYPVQIDHGIIKAVRIL